MNETERLRDALDHIIRQCDNAQSGNRRLAWIRTRAALALQGVDDWDRHIKPPPPSLATFPTPAARRRKDKITQILVANGFRERPLPGGGTGLSRSVYYAVEAVIDAYKKGELE